MTSPPPFLPLPRRANGCHNRMPGEGENDAETMTHPLYLELALLTENGKEAVKIASTAQNEYGLLPSVRASFRVSMLRNFYPEIPEGMIFHKDNFWTKFQVKQIWHTAWEGSEARKDSAAAWIRKQRETAIQRGHAWPPKPMFQRAFTVPQPRDGKDGATGWTPRKD